MTELFGSTGADKRLQLPVGRWLASLYAKGAHATLVEASAALGFLHGEPQVDHAARP
jgi:hypothetical protein